MNLNKYLTLTALILIPLILSACSSVGNTASNEMEGIELKLTINKKEISPDDVVVTVSLINHNDSAREIYVSIPKDLEEGISAVMVERKNKLLWQLLSPRNNQDISNIKERSFYDYVRVELGANETIEQEFSWNKELLNQESSEIVEAASGEYILSAFIILDELNKQKEYFEPEKQLISKLNFTVK